MIEDDPYADLKQHALRPETIIERRLEPKKIGKRREQFVMVPWTWIERLNRARAVSTYRVAFHILHKHWKKHGRPFVLGNRAMAEDGITRYRKRDALRELEELGLIQVERRVRKSPVIAVLLATAR
jgi:hypothetical protein